MDPMLSSQWTQIQIQNKIYVGVMKPTPSSNADDTDKATSDIIWQYISNAIKSNFVISIFGKYSEEI